MCGGLRIAADAALAEDSMRNRATLPDCVPWKKNKVYSNK